MCLGDKEAKIHGLLKKFVQQVPQRVEDRRRTLWGTSRIWNAAMYDACRDFSSSLARGEAELTLEFPHCYGGCMSLPNWRIGRALGIPIHVHASWFVVFFFVTWSLATGYLPETLPGLSAPRYWGMGGIAALLLFLSVLLHELGHSYVALRYQIPIKQITLFIFGGMAHMGKEPPSPRAEFLIAIAGPLVSLILGAGCLGGAMAVESLFARSGFQGLVVLGSLLGMVNVQLGLFNLIPGFPLDGGRVLRAGLWARNKDFDRATSQAALVGIGFGVALGLIGAVLMVGAWSGVLGQSIATNGGWLIFIGAFLFSAALASRRQAAPRISLASVTVRQVMVHRVVTLLPDMSVQDAVDQYFVAQGFGGFPYARRGRFLGWSQCETYKRFPQPSGRGAAFARSCARRRRPSVSLRTGPSCRRWTAWPRAGGIVSW